MNRICALACWCALVAGAAAQTDPAAPSAAAAPAGTAQPAAPGVVYVKMETSSGDIYLKLDGEKAPISVANFLQYADAGFYNGTIFHRVIPNFMIQGGGFLPDLTEKKDGLRDPIKNEWQNGLKNTRGTIAMARTQAPDSATAQFFINVVDNDRLDQPISGNAAYAVFGRVVGGMDVVDKIRNTPTKEDPKLPMGKVVPVEVVMIKSVARIDESKGKELEAAAVAAEEKERAEAAAAKERELNETIAKIEKETGKKVERTPSGLMYVILKDGAGASPAATDVVEVHYTGWLLNGTQFDSSVERGPAKFPLNRVIKGWTEGVGLMKVGEKRKLIIPSELAYGKPGRPPVIPPDSTLVFDVELLSIVPAATAPSNP